ncbi:glycosyltransferase family 61 protein [Haloplanus rubicundus]|uniref:Glycosyltransferase family 61 protein n=1 Tax=Haloplanus rubicundus TaxID=1547898 RepID=A0A345EBY3_9EURY|nr:glycosyltransferase family 61 protein [Haloplanus rubicundus]AXG09705.1 glycosyltransferase family 61 protein [Haloplanus rubicundus]
MSLIKKGIRILIADGPVEFAQRLYRSANSRAARRVIDLLYDSIVIDSNELKQLSSEYYTIENTAELPTPQEQSSLVPLSASEYTELHLEPRYRFRDPFVASISNVFVAGKNSLAYPERGGMIGDTIDFDIYNEIFTVDRIRRCLIEDISKDPGSIYPLLFGLSSPKQCSNYSYVTILHGRSHTYYQWMIYHLLKIRAAEYYKDKTGNEVHLIIPPDPPAYIKESLQLLGYSENEYTEWNGKTIKVKKLIVPSFPEPTPKAIQWLRGRLLAQVSKEETVSKWVYISRQSADKRRVLNFQEIEQVLNEYNIEIIELEKYPLSKQISIIHNADGIVGPHGAGLVNMIWADNLTVVELFGEVVDAPFFILADILGHKYKALSGKQVDSDKIHRDADFEIETKKLREILDSVIHNGN